MYQKLLCRAFLQDWPAKWPNFIPDIVAASKTNETLCENSMLILKLLSEEVFDFSRGELTQVSWVCLLLGDRKRAYSGSDVSSAFEG